MKKMMMILVFGLAAVVSAQQEWSSITGKVIKGWAGKNMFFVIKDNSSGQLYKANTVWADCAKAEGIFKESQVAGKDMCVEFQSHKDYANSIWRIRKIELLDASSPAKTAD